MGYMRHHAIVVTSWVRAALEAAHKDAEQCFTCVSPISDETINNYCSFFIPPDGSKEGWDESDLGDARRANFIRRLDEMRCDDGSSYLDWVEVQFGDDNRETVVTAHSDEPERWEGRG